MISGQCSERPPWLRDRILGRVWPPCHWSPSLHLFIIFIVIIFIIIFSSSHLIIIIIVIMIITTRWARRACVHGTFCLNANQVPTLFPIFLRFFSFMTNRQPGSHLIFLILPFSPFFPSFPSWLITLQVLGGGWSWKILCSILQQISKCNLTSPQYWSHKTCRHRHLS